MVKQDFIDDGLNNHVCSCNQGLHDGKRIDCNCECHNGDDIDG